jgi:hypothetical protein
MSNLEQFYTFLELNDKNGEYSKALILFIKVLVVMLTLTFLLGFSLLVYGLITTGVSHNVNFGILE